MPSTKNKVNIRKVGSAYEIEFWENNDEVRNGWIIFSPEELQEIVRQGEIILKDK